MWICFLMSQSNFGSLSKGRRLDSNFDKFNSIFNFGAKFCRDSNYQRDFLFNISHWKERKINLLMTSDAKIAGSKHAWSGLALFTFRNVFFVSPILPKNELEKLKFLP